MLPAAGFLQRRILRARMHHNFRRAGRQTLQSLDEKGFTDGLARHNAAKVIRHSDVMALGAKSCQSRQGPEPQTPDKLTGPAEIPGQVRGARMALMPPCPQRSSTTRRIPGSVCIC